MPLSLDMEITVAQGSTWQRDILCQKPTDHLHISSATTRTNWSCSMHIALSTLQAWRGPREQSHLRMTDRDDRGVGWHQQATFTSDLHKTSIAECRTLIVAAQIQPAGLSLKTFLDSDCVSCYVSVRRNFVSTPSLHQNYWTQERITSHSRLVTYRSNQPWLSGLIEFGHRTLPMTLTYVMNTPGHMP
jgi:hypothetical protein